VEETEEPTAVQGRKNVGHAVNACHCIYNTDKKYVEKPPLNEPPPKKQSGRYILRGKGPISDQELTR